MWLARALQVSTCLRETCILGSGLRCTILYKCRNEFTVSSMNLRLTSCAGAKWRRDAYIIVRWWRPSYLLTRKALLYIVPALLRVANLRSEIGMGSYSRKMERHANGSKNGRADLLLVCRGRCNNLRPGISSFHVHLTRLYRNGSSKTKNSWM